MCTCWKGKLFCDLDILLLCTVCYSDLKLVPLLHIAHNITLKTIWHKNDFFQPALPLPVIMQVYYSLVSGPSDTQFTKHPLYEKASQGSRICALWNTVWRLPSTSWTVEPFLQCRKLEIAIWKEKKVQVSWVYFHDMESVYTLACQMASKLLTVGSTSSEQKQQCVDGWSPLADRQCMIKSSISEHCIVAFYKMFVWRAMKEMSVYTCM